MKKRNLVMVLIGLSAITLSCKKENTENMSAEESADLIESTISSDDGGVTEDYKTAAQITSNAYDIFEFDCSFSDDTSYTLSADSGVRTYDLTSVLSWDVTCASSKVTEITFNLTKTGFYTGPRISRDGSTSGTFTFSELGSPSSTYKLNGSLSTVGTTEFTGRKKSGTAETTSVLTMSDVNVNKADYTLESGSATAVVDSEIDGNTVSFSASIVFANDVATVTVNGTAYSFQL